MIHFSFFEINFWVIHESNNIINNEYLTTIRKIFNNDLLIFCFQKFKISFLYSNFLFLIINFDFKYRDKENLPRGFATQIQEQSRSV